MFKIGDKIGCKCSDKGTIVSIRPGVYGEYSLKGGFAIDFKNAVLIAPNKIKTTEQFHQLLESLYCK